VEHNYKHIIWDWNGTLLDDAELCVSIINGILNEKGLPTLSLGKYRQLFDFPVKNYYQRLGFDFERYSFEEVGTQFILDYEKRKTEAGLRPEACEVLHAVVQSGRTQSILSAYRQDTLEAMVTGLGLRSLFLEVQGLNNHYAYGKEGAGELLLERLPYRSSEIVMVGDTLHDHEVARRLGVDCILIASGHQTRERLEETGAPICDNLWEVWKLIADDTDDKNG